MTKAALRILFVSSNYPDARRPNLGLFVARQIRHLLDISSFEAVVVAPIESPIRFRKLRAAPPVVAPAEVWDGVQVYRPRYSTVARLAWLAPAFLRRNLIRIARKLHGERAFDLVSAEFAWPDGPAAVAIGRKLGIPVSLKARGTDLTGPLSNRRERRILITACLEADCLLAVSEEIKAHMVLSGVPAERVHVHFPAVDAAMFYPHDRQASKAALGLAGPVLICVGNLIRRKRVDLAIRALGKLANATLLIVGSGPERCVLGQLVKDLGLSDRVRFLGTVNNESLGPYYSAADVMIHCAASEGFSNARLEAIACGTPVVTTNVGDAGNLIQSPMFGKIVGDDPEHIAFAAAELIKHPPMPSLVSAGAQLFTWRRATEQLAVLLEHVVT